jgi:hypothetical protein
VFHPGAVPRDHSVDIAISSSEQRVRSPKADPEGHDRLAALLSPHPIDRCTKVAITALVFEDLQTRHHTRHIIVWGMPGVVTKERIDRDDDARVCRELFHLSLEIGSDPERGRHDNDGGAEATGSHDRQGELPLFDGETMMGDARRSGVTRTSHIFLLCEAAGTMPG